MKKRVLKRTREKKTVKTYAFVDASNIIYGTRDEGWKSGGMARKANCDVDLTFYAMRDKDEFKRGIFLTGDGDFAILLEYFATMSKEVIVIANVKRTAREIKMLKGVEFNDLSVLRRTIKL